MKIKKHIKLIVPILIMILIGCFSVPQKKIVVNNYTIEAIGDFAPADTTLNLRLKIDPFTADGIYRANRILYRAETGQMNYYYYHRWISPPEYILADILANNLYQWKLFGGGIFQEETGIMPTHELQCRLNSLYSTNIKKQYQATLEITLTLNSIEPETFVKILIFQKQYSFTAERENAYISSFIPAIDTLTGKWLMEVRQDLFPILLKEAQKYPPAPTPILVPATTDTAESDTLSKQ